MIKNLSAYVKIDLISKISNSLKGTKEAKNDAWKESFGAWQSDESAEEMIESIRAIQLTIFRLLFNWFKK